VDSIRIGSNEDALGYSVRVVFRGPSDVRELLRDRVSRTKSRPERWGDSNESRYAPASAPPPPPYVGIFQWKWSDIGRSNEWIFPVSNLKLEVDGAKVAVYDWSNFLIRFPANRYDSENWKILFGDEARLRPSERWILTAAWPLQAVNSRWSWEPAYRIESGATNPVGMVVEMNHAWKRAQISNRAKGD
jgi:hypothetical protein